MRTCPTCNTQVSNDTRFCPECGSRLPDLDAASQSTPRTERLDAPQPVEPPIFMPPPAGGQPPATDRTIVSGAPLGQLPPAPGGLPPAGPTPYVPPAGAGTAFPNQGTGKRGPNWLLIIGGCGCVTLLVIGVGVLGLLGLLGSTVTQVVGTAGVQVETIGPANLANTAAAALSTPNPNQGGGTFATDLFYEDTFDRPARSDFTEDTSNSDAHYLFGDGTYNINIRTDELFAWASIPNETLDDGAIEVTVTITNDSPDSGSGGVLFRYEDSDNFYMFEVSGTGEYKLLEYVGNVPEVLIDWTRSNAVRGQGQPNTLRVELEGDLIRLFVNDQLLDEISDTSFSTGEIAIMAHANDVSGVTAEFDNLRVYRP